MEALKIKLYKKAIIKHGMNIKPCRDRKLIGIEIIEGSINIENYIHPERAIYILGAEDNGLSKEMIKKCHHIIQLPGKYCLNVATAGSIVMYDRYIKRLIK